MEEDAPPTLHRAHDPVLELYVLLDAQESPFERWYRRLRDRQAKLRIQTRLDRIALTGNLGDHKPVGAGVFELRVDYGPGYRLYFGRVGTTLIVLVVGGDKDSQSSDIERAKALWQIYEPRLIQEWETRNDEQASQTSGRSLRL